MSYSHLSNLLLEYARNLIRNGEYTESGMGRLLGISQPHVHNVMKGVRPVTPELFDLMLRRLGVDVLDLYTDAELNFHVTRRAGTTADRRPPERAAVRSSQPRRKTG